MKFCSTRDANLIVDFETAVLNSYAEDGGLYVPKDIPTLSTEKIKEICQLPYRNLVAKLLRYFIEDHEIPQENLENIIDESYSKFTNPDVARTVKLKDGLEVAEFFHGPTRTFKDMSTFVCAKVVSYFTSKRNERAIILAGTSGDTGNSLMAAFLGMENIDVIVWFPKKYCSKIQVLKMCTIIDDRMHCYAADGSSDDIDVDLKNIFLDKKFTKKYNVFSFNSINVLRIILQSALYFYIYGDQLKKSSSSNLEIVVPVGAAGNLSGGVLAKKMGLPIKLVAVTTANDIIHRTIKFGDLSVSDEVIKTLSPAMDIQVPYNIERVFYLLSEDKDVVSTAMKEFYEGGKAVIPQSAVKNVSSVISSFSATDEVKMKTIKRCFEENDYKICPHTSIAVSYFYNQLDNNLINGRVCVCVATASPARFPEGLQASGVEPAKDAAFANLTDLPSKFTTVNADENWEEIIREKIRSLRD